MPRNKIKQDIQGLTPGEVQDSKICDTRGQDLNRIGRDLSYVYLQIGLTRQGNTSIIEVPFSWSGCGRVVQGAGRKAKRMVLQCINGVSSNPVEGRTTI